VKFFNGAHRFLPTLIRMEGIPRGRSCSLDKSAILGHQSLRRLESLVQIVPRFACGTLDEIATDPIRNGREQQLIIDRFLAHSICLSIGKRRGLR
jgi:hypothetical protein